MKPRKVKWLVWRAARDEDRRHPPTYLNRGNEFMALTAAGAFLLWIHEPGNLDQCFKAPFDNRVEPGETTRTICVCRKTQFNPKIHAFSVYQSVQVLRWFDGETGGG